jgi:hypothetical protein
MTPHHTLVTHTTTLIPQRKFWNKNPDEEWPYFVVSMTLYHLHRIYSDGVDIKAKSGKWRDKTRPKYLGLDSLKSKYFSLASLIKKNIRPTIFDKNPNSYTTALRTVAIFNTQNILDWDLKFSDQFIRFIYQNPIHSWSYTNGYINPCIRPTRYTKSDNMMSIQNDYLYLVSYRWQQ